MPSVLDIIREVEIESQRERGGMFKPEQYGEVNLGAERRAAVREFLRELRWRLSLEDSRPCSRSVAPRHQGE